MGKRIIIEVDSNDTHLLDEAGYEAAVLKAQLSGEALTNLLTVLGSSTTESYSEDEAAAAATEVESEVVVLSNVLWVLLAVLCFLMGLSVGLSWYFKSSFSLYLENFLRRCCPKRFNHPPGKDPVLLTVADRQSRDNVLGGDEEGGQDAANNSTNNKEAEDKGTTTATIHASPPADVKAVKEGNETEAKDTGEDKKLDSNNTSEEGKDGKQEGGGGSTSSSSEEGEGEESSVRQRKNTSANASGIEEGDDATEGTKEKEKEEKPEEHQQQEQQEQQQQQQEHHQQEHQD